MLTFKICWIGSINSRFQKLTNNTMQNLKKQVEGTHLAQLTSDSTSSIPPIEKYKVVIFDRL